MGRQTEDSLRESLGWLQGRGPLGEFREEETGQRDTRLLIKKPLLLPSSWLNWRPTSSRSRPFT